LTVTLRGPAAIMFVKRAKQSVMSPDALAASLLYTIANDDLFAAVLDDKS
jgi:hypothetical protein